MRNYPNQEWPNVCFASVSQPLTLKGLLGIISLNKRSCLGSFIAASAGGGPESNTKSDTERAVRPLPGFGVGRYPFLLCSIGLDLKLMFHRKGLDCCKLLLVSLVFLEWTVYLINQQTCSCFSMWSSSRMPSLLEYLSYNCNFMGILAGPTCSYNDYMAFIEGTCYRPRLQENANGKENGKHQQAEPSPKVIRNII